MASSLFLYLFVFLVFWSLLLTFLVLRLTLHYNAFTKGTKKKDLLSVLNQLLKQTKNTENGLGDINRRLDQTIERARVNIKKVGFLRFNPFTDTGGDQSFSLCLLDENDSGFVLTSLHSRENTRLYAKKIITGKSPNQVLSKEEKEVLKLATQ